MNNTTNTPLLDAIGTNNGIGFEWGTSNSPISLLKTMIGNNQQSYHLPTGAGVKTPAAEITFLSAPSTVGIGFYGGVLALNGKIYTIPYDNLQVREIDPENNSSKIFGGSISATSNKYVGGALASNGLIYAMPKTAAKILEINPYTKSVVEIAFDPPLIGSFKGTVGHPNGKIYGMNFATSAGNFIEFNPITKAVSYFGNVGSNQFCGGVVAPNGHIYAIPEIGSGNIVAKLDVYNKTVTELPYPSSAGTNKWMGGVLAPNGKIYCVPNDAVDILVIDTLSDTFYKIPCSGAAGKYNGGALAPDGFIYCMPDGANNSPTTQGKIMLRINWTNDTWDTILIPLAAIPDSQSTALAGAIVTPSGKLVGIPQSNDNAVILNFNTPIDSDVCLSSVVNKF